MKIVILNMSPKGNTLSITMQYVKYTQRALPEHEYMVHAIGQKIKGLEDVNNMEKIISDIKYSDGIIWALPVYFYMAPGQMVKFIELIYDMKLESVFFGKYATSIITSVHIGDNFTGNYVRAVSEDLGMHYMDGYSGSHLEMDLMNQDHRRTLIAVMKHFYSAINEKRLIPHRYKQISEQYSALMTCSAKRHGSKSEPPLLLLTDHCIGSNLGDMVNTYLNESPRAVSVVNIRELNIKSPCAGCIKCNFEGKCIIHDDLEELFVKTIMPAPAIIIAGEIVHRSLSAAWKILIDRFMAYIGNRPVLMNKQIGYLLSGPLQENQFLRDALELFALAQQMNIAGFVTDEKIDNSLLLNNINILANDLEYGITNHIIRPQTFHGAGYKRMTMEMLFIWSGVKRAAYSYHKKHRLLWYPQFNLKLIFRKIILNLLFGTPFLKTAMKKRLWQLQMAQYRKLTSSP